MTAIDELGASPEDGGRRPLREIVWTWFNRAQFAIYTLALVLLLLLAYLAPFVFIMVPTGYSGVMYRYFQGGTVTDHVWGEGLHVIPPWDTLTLYEIRLIEERVNFTILSEEGLELGVEASVRYRPNKDMLGFLHQDIGPDYYERLIKPEVEAHVRKTFGRRPAHEIYATEGDLLQELRSISMLGRVDDSGEETTSSSFIQVQEIKVVHIQLPDIVENYIAARYGEEQKMLEYDYKLLREEKESERKRTEAAGIRDYNQIASTIAPDLLRWRDIDATLALAQSNNSKVVLLSAGAGETPLIFNLGGDSSNPPPAAAEPEPAPDAATPTGAETPATATGEDGANPPALDVSWDMLPFSSSLDLPDTPGTETAPPTTSP